MSDIKKCFISRFGGNGYIVEADFSQLEVIALAYLSQDVNLYADIISGVDMHCMNASFLYNKPYGEIVKLVQAGDEEWKKKRKISKAPGFLIQYGGGAKAMAKQTGLPESQCQEFITNYYLRYFGVQLWQESVAEEVQRTRRPTKELTEKGFTRGVGWYQSVTGRRYIFKEYDSPDWKVSKGEPTGFSPTQMKNYPVQGFATGDIVPLVLGKLFNELFKDKTLYNKALLINTVHDSILLDVHKDILYEACTLVKETMEKAPEYLQDTFGLTFDLPLTAEVSFGPNWLEQKEWKKS